jgi:hypothetical protein
VVCDPGKNALLKAGNKNDHIDARKLGMVTNNISEPGILISDGLQRSDKMKAAAFGARSFYCKR